MLFNWVVRLAYINILWILFSLVGLIFLGIGPATVSVFTVIRKLLDDSSDISIGKLFIQTYKKEFWSANKLMLIVFPVCLFIYIDFLSLQILPSSFFMDKIVFTGMIILSLLVIIWFSYLFAVYVHFDLRFITNFKYALLIAGINPLPTVLILFGLFVFSIVLSIVPAVSIFYLISVPIFIVQLGAKQAFRKVPKMSS